MQFADHNQTRATDNPNYGSLQDLLLIQSLYIQNN